MFTPVFGYTIIRLDSAFLRNEFLPALVDRHFRQAHGDEYRVAVVSRRDPSQVIYAVNVDNVADLLARHDAEADLFGLRPDQFQLIRQADRSLRGPNAPSGDRRRSLFFSMARRPPPPDEQGRHVEDAAGSEHAPSTACCGGSSWRGTAPDRSRRPWARRARATSRSASACCC